MSGGNPSFVYRTRVRMLSVVLLLAGLSLVCDRLHGAAVDNALRERFMKGTAAAEQALNNSWARGKYVITMTSSSSPAYENSNDYAFKGSGLAKKVEQEKEGIARLNVRNPRYAFSLTRGTQAKSYSLAWLAAYGANRRETETIEFESANGNALALGAVCVYGRFVWDLVRDPGFEVTAISTMNTDEEERVRVEFQYTPSDSETSLLKKIPMENAYLVCDPANHWRLCEYGRVVGRGGDRVVVDCVAGREGMLPMLSRQVSTRKNRAGEDLEFRHEIACVESTFEDVPEEEFYLSHYGLPEPTFERRWFGNWVWYLIAGIVCLVVSAKMLKRRRATG